MQPDVNFRLVVRRGPQPNQQYPLTRDTITIGRDITNDVVINDPEVSRHHARLIRTPSGYAIEDLRSTNAIFINRQKVTGSYQLNNGDVIGLGETVTLVYEVTGGAQAPTVVGGAAASPAGAPPPMQSPPPMSSPIPPPPPPPPMQQAPAQPVYDPHLYQEEEEEFEPDRNRIIIIGCSALLVLFCCVVVVAGIFIDRYQNGILYCEIPVLSTELFDCQ